MTIFKGFIVQNFYGHKLADCYCKTTLSWVSKYEPRHEKTGFFHMQKHRRRLISAFVFATRIVQFLYFLNLKFQASSHLLWLYSPVCVGSGGKPRRPVFSCRGSYGNLHSHSSALMLVLKQNFAPNNDTEFLIGYQKMSQSLFFSIRFLIY